MSRREEATLKNNVFVKSLIELSSSRQSKVRKRIGAPSYSVKHFRSLSVAPFLPKLVQSLRLRPAICLALFAYVARSAGFLLGKSNSSKIGLVGMSVQIVPKSYTAHINITEENNNDQLINAAFLHS